MDQTCFGLRGFFWPMSNPLFQGRRPLLIGRVNIGGAPPSRPPRRSIASVSFIRVTAPFWHKAATRLDVDKMIFCPCWMKSAALMTAHHKSVSPSPTEPKRWNAAAAVRTPTPRPETPVVSSNIIFPRHAPVLNWARATRRGRAARRAIDATRAASAHRFAFEPGDHLAHAAMNGTQRNKLANAEVMPNRSGCSHAAIVGIG
jgi:hypothetical protein